MRSLLLLALASAPFAGAADVTFPRIPEERIPVTELRISETAYAAVRKPPGEGPFPAVVFLHGGLGQSPMPRLKEGAVDSPAQARFLSWGYVTVNATRRAIRHDPQDRGVIDDTLAIVDAVKAIPEVDPESVALYGGSGGGTLALEVASVSDELAAIVAGEPATIIYMGMFTKEHVVLGPDGKPTGDRRWDVMNADPEQLYTSEIQRHTRAKLEKLNTPTLILHGDQHHLKNFNFGVFIPEMVAMGKPVEVMKFPGEFHGFYWGRGRIPLLAQRSNVNAQEWLRGKLPTQPSPVNRDWAETVVVEALKRPDNR